MISRGVKPVVVFGEDEFAVLVYFLHNEGESESENAVEISLCHAAWDIESYDPRIYEMGTGYVSF